MFLALSMGAALGALGLLFGLWQRRQAHTLREQMIAFHKAGLELEEKLKTAVDERDRWKNAAEGARANVLREVENLLHYNGTEAGQRDLSES